MRSLLLPSPSGTVAMTPTGPTQFSPASDPVPSGKAPFVGNILAFHTLSGAKFIVTYANHALNNSPPISAVVNDKNETLVEKKSKILTDSF